MIQNPNEKFVGCKVYTFLVAGTSIAASPPAMLLALPLSSSEAETLLLVSRRLVDFDSKMGEAERQFSIGSAAIGRGHARMGASWGVGNALALFSAPKDSKSSKPSNVSPSLHHVTFETRFVDASALAPRHNS